MHGRTRKIWVFTLVFLIAGSLVFSDGGRKHRKRLPRPIKLGVSGSNMKDFRIIGNQIACCGGTLGAELSDANGNLYVLSNGHVTGRVNLARPGEAITQPGNIDSECFNPPSDIVANQSKQVKIKFSRNANNKVDGSISRVIPGMVIASGFILDIGVPGQPVEAALGMKVFKSGRTTGFTQGTIDVINVTANVSFGRCGTSQSRVARFINQIAIRRGNKPFVDEGDSGALLLEAKKPCPRAVGLIFAGDSSGNGGANRIQDVLAQLSGASTPGLKMVGAGCPATPTETSFALTLMDSKVIAAKTIQTKYEDSLFKIPGVVSVGIGLLKPDTDSMELAIVVNVIKGSKAALSSTAIPASLDGMPVRREITSEFKAI
jgi:hypothetical protein